MLQTKTPLLSIIVSKFFFCVLWCNTNGASFKGNTDGFTKYLSVWIKRTHRQAAESGARGIQRPFENPYIRLHPLWSGWKPQTLFCLCSYNDKWIRKDSNPEVRLDPAPVRCLLWCPCDVHSKVSLLTQSQRTHTGRDLQLNGKRKSLTWEAWVYSRAFFLLNIIPQCCTLLEYYNFLLLYKPWGHSLVHYGYLAAVIDNTCAYFILYFTSERSNWKRIIRRDDGVDKESAQIWAWWPDRICGVSRGANDRCGGRLVTSTQVWTVEAGGVGGRFDQVLWLEQRIWLSAQITPGVRVCDRVRGGPDIRLRREGECHDFRSNTITSNR